MLTYRDAIDYTLAFLGSDVTAQSSRDARQAALTAYRSLTSAHHWSFYYRRGRFASVAPYSTGTITYTHTGGSSERLLTLAGGTWPTWATFGVIAIGGVSYEVAEYKTTTTITLSANNNPGVNVAAGTTYTLYRDTFPLPTDCLSIDKLLNVSHTFWMSYAHPRQWLERQQIYQGPSAPGIYTVMGDDNYLNVLALKLFPAPDAIYQFDFLYQRRPRPLLIDEYKTGTVSATIGTGTLTGSGTAWTSRHTGSVVRLYTDGVNSPTGLTGLYPYATERTVMSVESATSLTVDSNFGESYAAVKHLISDPVDVEEGAMLTAFLRGLEREVATIRRIKTLGDITAIYLAELRNAMAADSRSFERRAVGDSGFYRGRLADMPSGPDLT